MWVFGSEYKQLLLVIFTFFLRGKLPISLVLDILQILKMKDDHLYCVSTYTSTSHYTFQAVFGIIFLCRLKPLTL